MKLNPKKHAVWAISIPGVSGVGTDAYKGSIAGCDQTLDLLATEAAVSEAAVDDVSDAGYDLSGSSTGDGYTNDYQLFPDTEAEDDAVYFGSTIPFCEFRILVDGTGTPATYGADSIIWEYWNGSAWATLMTGHGFFDYTDSDDQDGDRPFQRNGNIVFIPPSDWATTTNVNGEDLYWVRARCTATVDITQTPVTDDKEHRITTPRDGFKCPEGGTIVGCRLTNGNATAHTAVDIKFFLMNFTTGGHSDEMNFAQDKRQRRFDGTDFKTGGLAIAAGDILGVVITQEDGTHELTNAILELDVDP